MDLEFEHIVIGAGISGLGIAHFSAQRGVSTLVLEGSERIGGCMNSQAFPDCGPFWTEAGSHTCFNSYGNLLAILTDLGLLERITPKAKLHYSLWHNGERKSIFSALHPWELAISLPRLFTGTKVNKGIAEYYGSGLGRRNYRDLFGPAFRAVICQDADDFPADLLFRRKPRHKEIVRSFTFPAGLWEIPLAIAGQQGLTVHTGQQVSAIAPDGDGYRVRILDGDELRCRCLTLAVPPDAAAALLRTGLPSALAQLGGLVGEIGMSRIETLALCVPARELAGLAPLAGLIAVDDAFYSMVTRDYLPDRDYRGFAFHFRQGVLDPEAQVERGCRALGIEPDRIAGLSRIDNQLPALRAGHSDRVGKIDALLAGSNLAITGNWFLGVSIEDCLTRSHREFERLFGK